MKASRTVLDKSRDECSRLAKELIEVRHVLDPEAPQASRTAGSVAAKLANFRALDPSSPSAGFSNVARVDREVWQEYAEDQEKLYEAARRIRSALRKVRV